MQSSLRQQPLYFFLVAYQLVALISFFSVVIYAGPRLLLEQLGIHGHLLYLKVGGGT